MKGIDGCNFETLFISITFLLNVLSANTISNDAIPCICPSESKCKLTCLNGTSKIDRNHNIQRREVDYEEVEIIDERKCNSKSLQNIMLQVNESFVLAHSFIILLV